MTIDDMELVRQYAAQRSESAFAALVSRHAGLVYSAALRQVRNPQLAEEITQAVFIILARKAGSLNERTILPSWLYRAACYTANSARKREHRRQQREQEACMQSTLQEAGTDAAWKQISPLLEEAMLRLGQTDRDALVLRFFEGRSLNEVGMALGASEGAAKKRVNRALDKLRKFFTKRGISSTTAIIAGAISTNSVQAAPVALTKAVTAIAVAKGAAASGSTLTLIQGALKIMAWTKAKTAIVAGAAVLFVTGTAVVVVEKVRSPSVDESLWEATVANLDKAPPVLIIRPTRFSDNASISRGAVVVSAKRVAGGTQSSDAASAGRNIGPDKFIAHNVDIPNLLQFAYSYYATPKIVLPEGVPTNHFDLMLTLPDHQREALQKAIRQKFGFTAHRETRETDALLLRVKNPDLLAAHAGKRGSKMDFKSGTNFWAYSNIPISIEAQMLPAVFFKPVILQPGLSGNYDITFRWEDVDAREQAVSDELAQAGLELVSTNLPVEMLVVEKAQ